MKLKLDWIAVLGLLSILATMFVSPPDSKAETLFGRVVDADRDTVTVLGNGNTQHVIRLFGIVVPDTSEKALSEFILGKDVNIELLPGTLNGRETGTVWAGPINANLEMVKLGYAWIARDYARSGLLPEDYRELEKAEHEARENGLGLWSTFEPDSPRRFRHPD